MKNSAAKIYEKHLFNETTDGYIHIMKAETIVKNRKKEKIFKVYGNTELKGLVDITEEVIGDKDVYITPNTTYIPFRQVQNIRQFRALFIDIDNLENDKLAACYRIFEMAEEKSIPKPTMIVDSGRGIHLYWRIVNAPFQALNTWQALEDYLYYKLKPFGADLKATDGARVLRLPATINSRNNSMCRVIYVDDKVTYSMYDLKKDFLRYDKLEGKQLQFQQTKKNSKEVVKNKFFNSYNLHITRANDLLTLCKLRNYDVEGYRNMILHCYAYWKGIYIRDFNELETIVFDLNNSFKKPLKENEVNAILKCIPKAIEKFINYEQGLNAGKVKRVSKGMRDKEGYWYRNETLIERLNITIEEQLHMDTIISLRVKYDRNNKNRREARRNENGLTSREQKKFDLINKVKELKLQGLKQKDIALKLGITKGTVSKYLKL